MNDINQNVPKTDGTELSRLASQLTRDRQAILAADTNEIYKTIVTDNRPKVSEEIFIKYFLEPFSNFKNIEINSPEIARWIDIAGNFYGEVDIVDKHGSVICTCPSIYQPLSIDSELDNVNFTNIARDFINKSNHFAASGINYLYGGLNYIGQSLHGNTEDNVNKWASILQYFNTKVNGGKPSLAIANNKPSTLEQKENFEEYMEFE